MEKEKVAQILKDYTKLQEKVLEVNKKLYDSKIDREQYQVYAEKIEDIDSMTFHQDSDVSIGQTTYGWGNCENYLSTFFSTEWLNLSDDELLERARIKKQEKDKIEAQKKEEQTRIEAEKKEKKEREQYEKLKAKFQNK